MDLLLAAFLAAAADTTAPPVPTPPVAAPDTVREVRRFPPIEVSAGRIHDFRSSATVHTVSGEALRDLPLSSLAQALALQPGVVAVGDDVHVRGGRAGETQWTLGGLVLNEPMRDRAPELPLLAIQRADLLAGGLDAEYAGALAGVLDVRTANPTPRPSGAARWLSSGRHGTAYDWLGARGSLPLPVAGLGLVAAGEARLDDQFLPGRSARGREAMLGRRFGWRNDNRVLGWAKLASVANPQAFSLEAFGSRVVAQPYDPMFSWDDSVLIQFLRTDCQFCPPYLDSLTYFYRASDHQPMSETRRLTTIAQAAWLGQRWQWRASLGWLHGTELVSPGLARDPRRLLPAEKLRFGDRLDPDRDPFRAYAGDWAYFKRTRADRLQAALSATLVRSPKHRLGFGAGVSWDEVEFLELDAVEPTDSRSDSVREFRTRAPGGWAYAQHRWEREGLVWNGGLRLQAFDAGRDASAPAGTGPAGVAPLVRSPGAHWRLSPRLGLAFPLSVRDAMSLSYARIHQPPAREHLADSRLLIYGRRPLGNPSLEPGELVTYQAGLKHLFDERWAAHVSVFQRDLYGQVGIVNDPYFTGTFRARYANAEYGHATGFEIALLAGARREGGARGVGGEAAAPARGGPGGGRLARLGSALARTLAGEFSLRYTFMSAHGTLSGTDGWSYGEPFGFRPLPLGEHPLDWDRGHMFNLDAVWREARAFTFAWVTQVASGARWTPTVSYTGAPGGPLVAPDLAAVNSRQLPWSERTDVALRLEPVALRGGRLLVEVRNLFDSRGDAMASLAGFPHPFINTRRDDYAGYRTDTGRGGGGYWDPALNGGAGGWVPVGDPRLARQPRALRLGIEVGM